MKAFSSLIAVIVIAGGSLLSGLLAFALGFNAPTAPIKTPPVVRVAPKYDAQATLNSIFTFVECEYAVGSGCVFQRPGPNGTHYTFVWTCAHILLAQPDDKRLDPKKAATIPCQVLIHGTAYAARVIAIGSDSPGGTDVALLQVDGFSGTTGSVKFDNNFPVVGAAIDNLGAAYGDFDSPSYFCGVVSALGKIVNDQICDQLQIPSIPGCSGSAILNSKGECEGLMEAHLTDSVSLDVPSRRILQWAYDNHVEWALNASVAVPPTVENYEH